MPCTSQPRAMRVRLSAALLPRVHFYSTSKAVELPASTGNTRSSEESPFRSSVSWCPGTLSNNDGYDIVLEN